ncbi:MAG: hypothetical protein AAGH19_07530 [Pseudomonadota bacterium]
MFLFHEFIWPFHAVVLAHIVTGSVGLVAFWVPVVAKKGAERHKSWGRVFTGSMLLTGGLAVGIATLTLLDPIGTHPHVDFPEPFISGIFGWMMLYLALLTMNLAWYGWECIQLRRNHAGHRSVLNITSQVILFLASLNCAIRGVQLEQVLMIGISFVGFATVATNLRFMLRKAPGPQDWLKEHLTGLVGAGISVYTAFLAFGAVRLMPELALNPGLWAVPLVTGVAIILYHWIKIWRMEATLKTRRAALESAD